MEMLRQKGVVAKTAEPVQDRSHKLIEEEFGPYLRNERALAPATIAYYLYFSRQFLLDRFAAGQVQLSALRAADVVSFVQRQALRVQRKRAKLLTTALRSFLQFARYGGYIQTDLAAAVPTVANWSMASIPKALPPEHVRPILAHCNRQTATGRRDYAILLLLARLGLRAGEIVAMELEDIDWHGGHITVRGKGGNWTQLPLPADVGEAVAAYLRDGRPTATTRRVFLRARAPIRGFQDHRAVSSLVKHALARAGIASTRKGAHQFRHLLATELLRKGASLSEIGELLRHRSPQTTAIYAKVDTASLRTLALPWPGGAR